ncbi:MAG: OmpH family outer membrane protein [Thermodesulfobacteriota bacterium]
MVRKLVAISLGLLTAGIFCSLAQAQMKFGVVDLQKALNLSTAGKKARESISKRAEEAKRVIKAKDSELRTLRAELEKQSLLLTEEARLEKAKAFESKRRDYERFFKDSREELALEERRLTNKILRELEKVVQKLGQEEGFTFIFERSQGGLIYAANSVDLTNRMIELYDAKQQKQ